MSPALFATFLFELQGQAVGLVELARAGDSYTYRSRHWFARKAVDQRETIDLRTGPLPESLWFYARPKPGCVDVRAELTGELKKACATAASAEKVRGTIGDDSFEAEYREEHLVELTIGAAHFRRVAPGTKPATPADPFDKGFPIDGTNGPLRLEPPVAAAARAGTAVDAAAARKLARVVHDTVDGDCVAHAVRFVQQLPQAVVVYGLVLDEGRAWPHAWVRAGSLELDPTLDRAVTPDRYLDLGADPGRVYVDLLSGARRVVRR